MTTVTVADLMHAPIRTVKPLRTLRQVAGELTQEAVGALVVADHRGLHGIFSEADLARGIADGGHLDEDRVRDHMTETVISVEPETPAAEAATRMAAEGIRHLMVRDGETPVGMISARDLLAEISRLAPATAG